MENESEWDISAAVSVDDVKLLGENIKTVKKQTESLLWASWEVGLEMLRKLSACW
jgi:hypothetical protein